ncbi:hypothetical protein Dsin_018945 [Dipteronia sinensis]|uniref:Peptidyl-prolyl cis-trans isomerase n=1 Tax=Dipteronia sinensis TaxID=43782 RepID=A0AAE0E3K2_9ROSI|nr:hypothetical protein Dsin_018945 [Dipteronia sinensis]
MANPRVFFDLSIDGHPAGRIVMELFADSTPITEENFRALCIGEKGIDTIRKPLHYKGSTIHRVKPGYMVHGGDITHGNATGDENFVKKHIGPGIMSMAKIGTRDNGSQFFICTAKTEWLGPKQVIFGQLVKGFEVLKAVDKIGSSSGFTSKPVMGFTSIDSGLQKHRIERKGVCGPQLDPISTSQFQASQIIPGLQCILFMHQMMWVP